MKLEQALEWYYYCSSLLKIIEHNRICSIKIPVRCGNKIRLCRFNVHNGNYRIIVNELNSDLMNLTITVKRIMESENHVFSSYADDIFCSAYDDLIKF